MTTARASDRGHRECDETDLASVLAYCGRLEDALEEANRTVVRRGERITELEEVVRAVELDSSADDAKRAMAAAAMKCEELQRECESLRSELEAEHSKAKAVAKPNETSGSKERAGMTGKRHSMAKSAATEECSGWGDDDEFEIHSETSQPEQNPAAESPPPTVARDVSASTSKDDLLAAYNVLQSQNEALTLEIERLQRENSQANAEGDRGTAASPELVEKVGAELEAKEAEAASPAKSVGWSQVEEDDEEGTDDGEDSYAPSAARRKGGWRASRDLRAGFGSGALAGQLETANTTIDRLKEHIQALLKEKDPAAAPAPQGAGMEADAEADPQQPVSSSPEPDVAAARAKLTSLALLVRSPAQQVLSQVATLQADLQSALETESVGDAPQTKQAVLAIQSELTAFLQAADSLLKSDTDQHEAPPADGDTAKHEASTRERELAAEKEKTALLESKIDELTSALADAKREQRPAESSGAAPAEAQQEQSPAEPAPKDAEGWPDEDDIQSHEDEERKDVVSEADERISTLEAEVSSLKAALAEAQQQGENKARTDVVSEATEKISMLEEEVNSLKMALAEDAGGNDSDEQAAADVREQLTAALEALEKEKENVQQLQSEMESKGSAEVERLEADVPVASSRPKEGNEGWNNDDDLPIGNISQEMEAMQKELDEEKAKVKQLETEVNALKQAQGTQGSEGWANGDDLLDGAADELAVVQKALEEEIQKVQLLESELQTLKEATSEQEAEGKGGEGWNAGDAVIPESSGDEVLQKDLEEEKEKVKRLESELENLKAADAHQKATSEGNEGWNDDDLPGVDVNEMLQKELDEEKEKVKRLESELENLKASDSQQKATPEGNEGWNDDDLPGVDVNEMLQKELDEEKEKVKRLESELENLKASDSQQKATPEGNEGWNDDDLPGVDVNEMLQKELEEEKEKVKRLESELENLKASVSQQKATPEGNEGWNDDLPGTDANEMLQKELDEEKEKVKRLESELENLKAADAQQKATPEGNEGWNDDDLPGVDVNEVLQKELDEEKEKVKRLESELENLKASDSQQKATPEGNEGWNDDDLPGVDVNEMLQKELDEEKEKVKRLESELANMKSANAQQKATPEGNEGWNNDDLPGTDVNEMLQKELDEEKEKVKRLETELEGLKAAAAQQKATPEGNEGWNDDDLPGTDVNEMLQKELDEEKQKVKRLETELEGLKAAAAQQKATPEGNEGWNDDDLPGTDANEMLQKELDEEKEKVKRLETELESLKAAGAQQKATAEGNEGWNNDDDDLPEPANEAAALLQKALDEEQEKVARLEAELRALKATGAPRSADSYQDTGLKREIASLAAALEEEQAKTARLRQDADETERVKDALEEKEQREKHLNRALEDGKRELRAALADKDLLEAKVGELKVKGRRVLEELNNLKDKLATAERNSQEMETNCQTLETDVRKAKEQLSRAEIELEERSAKDQHQASLREKLTEAIRDQQTKVRALEETSSTKVSELLRRIAASDAREATASEALEAQARKIEELAADNAELGAALAKQQESYEKLKEGGRRMKALRDKAEQDLRDLRQATAAGNKEEADDLGATITRLRKQAESEKETAELELTAKAEEIEALQKTLREEAEKAEKFKEGGRHLRDVKNEALEKLKASEKANNDRKTEIKALKRKLESAVAEVESVHELREEVLQQLENTQEALAASVARVKESEKEVERVQLELEMLQEAKKDVTDALQATEQELTESRRTTQQLTENLANAERVSKEREQAATDAQKELKTARHDLAERERDVTQGRKREADLKEKLDSECQRCAAAEAENSELTVRVDTLTFERENVTCTLEQKGEEIGSLRSRIKQLERQVEDTGHEVANLQRQAASATPSSSSPKVPRIVLPVSAPEAVFTDGTSDENSPRSSRNPTHRSESLPSPSIAELRKTIRRISTERDAALAKLAEFEGLLSGRQHNPPDSHRTHEDEGLVQLHEAEERCNQLLEQRDSEKERCMELERRLRELEAEQSALHDTLQATVSEKNALLEQTEAAGASASIDALKKQVEMLKTGGKRMKEGRDEARKALAAAETEWCKQRDSLAAELNEKQADADGLRNKLAEATQRANEASSASEKLLADIEHERGEWKARSEKATEDTADALRKLRDAEGRLAQKCGSQDLPSELAVLREQLSELESRRTAELDGKDAELRTLRQQLSERPPQPQTAETGDGWGAGEWGADNVAPSSAEGQREGGEWKQKCEKATLRVAELEAEIEMLGVATDGWGADIVAPEAQQEEGEWKQKCEKATLRVAELEAEIGMLGVATDGWGVGDEAGDETAESLKAELSAKDAALLLLEEKAAKALERIAELEADVRGAGGDDAVEALKADLSAKEAAAQLWKEKCEKASERIIELEAEIELQTGATDGWGTADAAADDLDALKADLTAKDAAVQSWKEKFEKASSRIIELEAEIEMQDGATDGWGSAEAAGNGVVEGLKAELSAKDATIQSLKAKCKRAEEEAAALQARLQSPRGRPEPHCAQGPPAGPPQYGDEASWGQDDASEGARTPARNAPSPGLAGRYTSLLREKESLAAALAELGTELESKDRTLAETKSKLATLEHRCTVLEKENLTRRHSHDRDIAQMELLEVAKNTAEEESRHMHARYRKLEIEASSVASSEAEKRVDLQSKVEGLKKTLAQAERNAAEARRSQQEYQKALDGLQRKLRQGELEAKVEQLQAENAQLRGRRSDDAAQLESLLSDSRQEVAALRRQLADLLVTVDRHPHRAGGGIAEGEVCNENRDPPMDPPGGDGWGSDCDELEDVPAAAEAANDEGDARDRLNEELARVKILEGYIATLRDQLNASSKQVEDLLAEHEDAKAETRAQDARVRILEKELTAARGGDPPDAPLARRVSMLGSASRADDHDDETFEIQSDSPTPRRAASKRDSMTEFVIADSDNESASGLQSKFAVLQKELQEKDARLQALSKQMDDTEMQRADEVEDAHLEIGELKKQLSDAVAKLELRASEDSLLREREAEEKEELANALRASRAAAAKLEEDLEAVRGELAAHVRDRRSGRGRESRQTNGTNVSDGDSATTQSHSIESVHDELEAEVDLLKSAFASAELSAKEVEEDYARHLADAESRVQALEQELSEAISSTATPRKRNTEGWVQDGMPHFDDDETASELSDGPFGGSVQLDMLNAEIERFKKNIQSNAEIDKSLECETDALIESHQAVIESLETPHRLADGQSEVYDQSPGENRAAYLQATVTRLQTRVAELELQLLSAQQRCDEASTASSPPPNNSELYETPLKQSGNPSPASEHLRELVKERDAAITHLTEKLAAQEAEAVRARLEAANRLEESATLAASLRAALAGLQDTVDEQATNLLTAEAARVQADARFASLEREYEDRLNSIREQMTASPDEALLNAKAIEAEKRSLHLEAEVRTLATDAQTARSAAEQHKRTSEQHAHAAERLAAEKTGLLAELEAAHADAAAAAADGEAKAARVEALSKKLQETSSARDKLRTELARLQGHVLVVEKAGAAKEAGHTARIEELQAEIKDCIGKREEEHVKAHKASVELSEARRALARGEAKAAFLTQELAKANDLIFALKHDDDIDEADRDCDTAESSEPSPSSGRALKDDQQLDTLDGLPPSNDRRQVAEERCALLERSLKKTRAQCVAQAEEFSEELSRVLADGQKRQTALEGELNESKARRIHLETEVRLKDDDLTSLREEFETLKARTGALEDSLSATESSLKRHADELRKKSATIKKLQSELSSTTKQLTSAQQAIDQQTAENSRLNDTLTHTAERDQEVKEQLDSIRQSLSVKNVDLQVQADGAQKLRIQIIELEGQLSVLDAENHELRLKVADGVASDSERGSRVKELEDTVKRLKAECAAASKKQRDAVRLATEREDKTLEDATVLRAQAARVAELEKENGTAKMQVLKLQSLLNVETTARQSASKEDVRILISGLQDEVTKLKQEREVLDSELKAAEQRAAEMCENWSATEKMLDEAKQKAARFDEERRAAHDKLDEAIRKQHAARAQLAAVQREEEQNASTREEDTVTATQLARDHESRLSEAESAATELRKKLSSAEGKLRAAQADVARLKKANATSEEEYRRSVRERDAAIEETYARNRKLQDQNLADSRVIAQLKTELDVNDRARREKEELAKVRSAEIEGKLKDGVSGQKRAELLEKKVALIEGELDIATERLRAAQKETEDATGALWTVEKQKSDLEREIRSVQTGVLDAERRASEAEASAQSAGLQNKKLRREVQQLDERLREAQARTKRLTDEMHIRSKWEPKSAQPHDVTALLNNIRVLESDLENARSAMRAGGVGYQADTQTQVAWFSDKLLLTAEVEDWKRKCASAEARVDALIGDLRNADEAVSEAEATVRDLQDELLTKRQAKSDEDDAISSDFEEESERGMPHAHDTHSRRPKGLRRKSHDTVSNGAWVELLTVEEERLSELVTSALNACRYQTGLCANIRELHYRLETKISRSLATSQRSNTELRIQLKALQENCKAAGRFVLSVEEMAKKAQQRLANEVAPYKNAFVSHVEALSCRNSSPWNDPIGRLIIQNHRGRWCNALEQLSEGLLKATTDLERMLDAFTSWDKAGLSDIITVKALTVRSPLAPPSALVEDTRCFPSLHGDESVDAEAAKLRTDVRQLRETIASLEKRGESSETLSEGSLFGLCVTYLYTLKSKCKLLLGVRESLTQALMPLEMPEVSGASVKWRKGMSAVVCTITLRKLAERTRDRLRSISASPIDAFVSLVQEDDQVGLQQLNSKLFAEEVQPQQLSDEEATRLLIEGLQHLKETISSSKMRVNDLQHTFAADTKTPTAKLFEGVDEDTDSLSSD
ncbi:hypothetical protein DIPPA_22416 [Diplonema papillatum]|nr:hypothetical protein DIPPA_22416 [Diplonema papillatum]